MDFRTTPKTYDNREIVKISSFPSGTHLYRTSRSDDLTNKIRGKGDFYTLELTDVGEISLTSGFIDWVELYGGIIQCSGAQHGDRVSFEIFAPATTLSETPATGNCNLVDYLIIPAPNNDGSHNLNNSLNSLDPVPLPNLLKNGYWNWNYPDVGLGTVTPVDDISKPDGNVDLITVQKTLDRFLNEIYIFGDNVYNIVDAGVNNTKMFPQWRKKLTLINSSGGHTVKIWAQLVSARIKTCD